uniref:Interleukin 1 receptor type 1 n=1 Tax=Meleagris gallopavo TaxID=9103 RepID=G3UP79_MELGA
MVMWILILLRNIQIKSISKFSFSLSLFFFLIEECVICNYFVLVGEPTAISCPVITLPMPHSDYNLTWYKNGSSTPITTERHARIHQRKGLLWFIPATLEDSGLYECEVRSLNRSKQKIINLKVFKNDNDLCFNGEMKYDQIVKSANAGKIICPDLENFKDEDNINPEIHWYKECKSGFLEDKRLVLAEGENAILILNATIQDKGNYTCRMVYTFMGKQYNVSRTMNLEVKESPLKMRPEFIYPNNNTIEVELGSQVTVDCNTTGADGFEVFWTGNGVYIDVFYVSRIFAKPNNEETAYDGRPVYSVKLIISEVHSEDYEQPFVCQASNAFGQVASYIILKHRAPDVQRWLTGVFVSFLLLTFIILVVYKIFKIDLVLWYRNFGCAFVSKEDGKIYDACVLYTKGCGGSNFYRLETFVLRILPNVLEQQCGYNLFILGRDDLPGEAVVSVADEIFKQSRRLMIIFGSETFSCVQLEDASEQQLALYSALIRDETQVILIEMDGTQDYTSMPESIRYIKQKHGAIQWKGDFSEKSCSANTKFWKNVRYQMPAKKKVSFSEVYLSPQTLNNSAAKGN